MKQFRYALEGVILWIALMVFRIMPAETASAVGGWIGRTIGPKLAASRKAYNNLRNALPGRSESDYQQYVHDMWDNLGRVIAEYPHLRKLVRDAEVVGIEHMEALRGNRFVALGAHLSNWEIVPFYFNYRSEFPTTCVYREPNNPYAAHLLEQCRNPDNKPFYASKSASGSRNLVKSIREGGSVGILFDQKYNQGIRADFFGQPAMTSQSFATLARKYDCPIIPVWVERIEGAKFRVVIEPSFTIDGRSDEEMVAYAHNLLEQEILKKPAHWLWLHRRWIT